MSENPDKAPTTISRLLPPHDNDIGDLGEVVEEEVEEEEEEAAEEEEEEEFAADDDAALLEPSWAAARR